MENDRKYIMKIWVLGRALPRQSNGFTGAFEFEQAKMLANYGYEVYYVDSAATDETGKKPFAITKTVLSKVYVITLSVPIFEFFPSRLKLGFLRWAKILSYRVVANKFGLPDIIHIHYPCMYPYIFFKYFQKKGCRIVATEHWSKVQMKQLKKRFVGSLNNFVLYSDSFICVSDLLKRAVTDITKTKKEIKVIPNVLSPIFCENNGERIGHEGFNYLAVGRLDPIKHFDFLISVFANTFHSNDNVSLTIVGAGAQESELRKLIDKLNCADRVKLAGYTKPDALQKLYLKSDALVVTSKLETFCLPIAEAMSCGLPVITTRNVGAAEYINNGRGIIVEYNNATQLSDAMRYMIQKYNIYSKDDIRKYALELFHPKVILKQLIGEYEAPKNNY